MRGLYQVWIVDPKLAGTVIHRSEQVARDEETARLKALVAANTELVPNIADHIEDYDIICQLLGEVRPKENERYKLTR